MYKSIALKNLTTVGKLIFSAECISINFACAVYLDFREEEGLDVYVMSRNISVQAIQQNHHLFPFLVSFIPLESSSAKIWSLINISTRAFRSRPTISSCCFCVRNRPRFELALCNFFHILPPSPIFRLFFFSSESLPVCLPRRRRHRHHSSSSVSVAMQMACRSFNSPIARNKFYISTRMMSTYDGFFSSLLFAPLSSGKQSWIGTLESSLTRSASSVIYGFSSCFHRGGVMTGRSAPGYHLYRFPIAPSLVCLTSPLSIPRDASRWRLLLGQTIFDGFWILNCVDHRWRTHLCPFVVILDTSLCIQLVAYFRNDLVDISLEIISKNPFVTRVSKLIFSMQTC